jgi:DNA-binding CsgD family transcriptional regulator
MNARIEPVQVKLTPRESEVLRLMAAGLQNEGIAVELEFGIDNAKIHARHIFSKLGAANRTDAVSVGFTSGLLDLDDIKALRATVKAAALEADAKAPAEDEEQEGVVETD